MESEEINRLVRDLGGVATRAQLMIELNRTSLDHAVAAGDLVPIARGRYAVPSTPPTQVAAASVSGVLSGLSAAQWWGWGLKKDPPRPEVTVARNRVVHAGHLDVRRRDLPPGAVTGCVLTRAHAVVDVARWHPFDVALCVADSALREAVVTRSDLAAACATVPRTGRRRVERVLDLASPKAANAFESTARAHAYDVVDLRAEPQVEVGSIHSIGRADLVDADLKIVVECESWAYHSGEQPFRRDIRRCTDMVKDGWLVARFVWEDVMVRPEVVVAALAALVELRRADTQFAAVFAARRSAR